MGDTLKKMKARFAPYEVPEMLADLCSYWDKHPEFFAGSFEVDSDEYESAKAWFRDNKEGYSQVRVFGIDGIHSLYAFWLFEDKTPENAPIIYLGGEGEGTTVFANNLSEFFTILASNKEYEPFDHDFCDEEEENEAENKRFRKWVKEKYNLLPAKNPMDIVKNARKTHPQFNPWLKKIIPGWK